MTTTDQIDHDYLLPLENGYTDLQKEFFENKRRLQSTLFDIEEVVDGMNKILKTSNLDEAFKIYGDIIKEHGERSPINRYISFSADFFNDEDFIEAARKHKERLAAIRNQGVESSFFSLLESFKKLVAQQTAKLELSEADKVKVIVKYSPKTLEEIVVDVHKTDYKGECPIVKSSILGHQEFYFCPWDWLSFDIRAGKEVVPAKSSDIEQQYINSSFLFSGPFEVQLVKHLVGIELIAPSLERFDIHINEN